MTTTASGDARLDRAAQVAVEATAIDRFNKPSGQWGGEDCKRILRDWFPELLARVRARKGSEAIASDYEDEMEVVWLLEDLRDAFSSNINRTLCDTVQDPIWTWPSEWQLQFSSKTWTDTSPTDAESLARSLSGYVERPWLQHNIIDGAAINAFLFSAFSHAMDLYRKGAFGPTDWRYMLRTMGFQWPFLLNQVVGLFLMLVFFPFLKWMMLPVIGAGLIFLGYSTAGEVTFGLWLAFVVYELLTLRKRRRRRVDADRTISAMRAAWEHSCGEVINPTRLRELVLDAEEKGAIDYPPVLHALIDRAIQRDPTAMLTRKMPASA